MENILIIMLSKHVSQKQIKHIANLAIIAPMTAETIVNQLDQLVISIMMMVPLIIVLQERNNWKSIKIKERTPQKCLLIITWYFDFQFFVLGY